MSFRSEFALRVARPAMHVQLPASGYTGEAFVEGLNIRWGFGSAPIWMKLRLMTNQSFSPEQVRDMIFVMNVLEANQDNRKYGENVVVFTTFMVVNDPSWRLW